MNQVLGHFLIFKENEPKTSGLSSLLVLQYNSVLHFSEPCEMLHQVILSELVIQVTHKYFFLWVFKFNSPFFFVLINDNIGIWLGNERVWVLDAGDWNLSNRRISCRLAELGFDIILSGFYVNSFLIDEVTLASIDFKNLMLNSLGHLS
jgi:hypothetical protein